MSAASGGRFRRPCGGRWRTGTAASAPSRAAGSGARTRTIWRTGRTGGRPGSRIWSCCADVITGRCTKEDGRCAGRRARSAADLAPDGPRPGSSSTAPTDDGYPAFPTPRTSPPTPSVSSSGRTGDAGSGLTPGRPPPGGRESGSICIGPSWHSSRTSDRRRAHRDEAGTMGSDRPRPLRAISAVRAIRPFPANPGRPAHPGRLGRSRPFPTMRAIPFESRLSPSPSFCCTSSR